MIEELERQTDEMSTQTLIKSMVDEAISWREGNLDKKQADATDLYKGAPLGNEVDGRSKVVMTTVRDTVRRILPSLLKIFTGSDHPLEFRGRGGEDVELARQMTDYVRLVVMEDNPGFLTLHSWFKDALIRKMGVLKWWWDDSEKVEGESHSGLTAEEVAMLSADPHVTDLKVEDSADQPAVAGAIGADGPAAMPPALYDVTLKRVFHAKRARFTAVPPEEFIWSPGARTLEEAQMVGHVRPVPKSDLIAMGLDPDEVEEAQGETVRVQSGQLDSARRVDGGYTTQDAHDVSRTPVEYGEIYAYVNLDEDEIAELRKFCVLGPSRVIVNGDGEGEIVAHRPFAILCPDPEPHTLVGDSVADLTGDLQKINSAIMRGILDSLVAHLNPAMGVVEGDVNVDDVLNQELGRVIRMRKPNSIQEITTTFVGEDALPLLAYMDTVREDRTGISRTSAGLDADSFQSMTEVAVQSINEGSREQIEMIARIFAETGVKELYHGLLRLVIENQDEERVVRLRNQWVPVDPRSWNAEMDLEVNVVLGNALVRERIQTLMAIQAKQEAYLQSGVPFVSFVELRNTAQALVEALGRKDVDRFFKPWGPQEQQAFEQQKAQSPQPQDPNVLKAQVDLQIAQLQAQLKQIELQIRATAEEHKHERETARMQQDFDLKAAELEMKHHHGAAETEVEAHLRKHEIQTTDARERDKASAQLQIERDRLAAEAAQAAAAGATQAGTEE